MWFTVSGRPHRIPLLVVGSSLLRWLGLPSKWPGWTEKMNSQMPASLIPSLSANIVAARFTVMQRCLE